MTFENLMYLEAIDQLIEERNQLVRSLHLLRDREGLLDSIIASEEKVRMLTAELNEQGEIIGDAKKAIKQVKELKDSLPTAKRNFINIDGKEGDPIASMETYESNGQTIIPIYIENPSFRQFLDLRVRVTNTVNGELGTNLYVPHRLDTKI
jgi:hypothetical protein